MHKSSRSYIHATQNCHTSCVCMYMQHVNMYVILLHRSSSYNLCRLYIYIYTCVCTRRYIYVSYTCTGVLVYILFFLFLSFIVFIIMIYSMIFLPTQTHVTTNLALISASSYPPISSLKAY